MVGGGARSRGDLRASATGTGPRRPSPARGSGRRRCGRGGVGPGVAAERTGRGRPRPAGRVGRDHPEGPHPLDGPSTMTALDRVGTLVPDSRERRAVRAWLFPWATAPGWWRAPALVAAVLAVFRALLG